MSQAINDRIEEIFIGALACAGDNRTAFLEAACGDDLAMRDCVLELFRPAADVAARKRNPETATRGRSLSGVFAR